MDVDKVVDEVTDMVVAIKVEKVVGMVFLFLYSDYFYDWKFQHSLWFHYLQDVVGL